MILIRDAKQTDHYDLFMIVEENWGSEIAVAAIKEFDEMFTSNSKWPPHYLVAEIDGKVVGCGGYKSAWLMSNFYELIWINIKKEHQGSGIGRMLTEERIARIKSLGGTAILLSTQNPDWFQQFGFKIVDRFYPHEDKPHWNLMTLQLGPVELSGDK